MLWQNPRFIVVMAGALFIGGCVGAPTVDEQVPKADAFDPEDLQMERFKLMSNNGTGAAWRWTGDAPVVVSESVGPPQVARSGVEVPAAWTGRIEVSVALGNQGAFVRLAVVDKVGSQRCFATTRCLIPIDEAFSQRQTWQVEIWVLRAPPGTVFAVDLALTSAFPWLPIGWLYGPGGDNATPLPPARTFHVFDAGFATSEPTVGAAANGDLFTTAAGFNARGASGDGNGVLRSRDFGRSWEYLDVGIDTVDGDPWLWLDPLTSRIFRLVWNSPCPDLAMSDDGGGTWTVRSRAGCGLQGGHYQKLTTGPRPAGISTSGYPNVVHYASTLLIDPSSPGGVMGARGVWGSSSLDGGTTWRLGGEIHPWRAGCHGWAGPTVVTPDGTAYNPVQYCDGVRIAVSRDGGQTWRQDAMLDELGHMDGILGPSMATDADGRLYLIYPDRHGKAQLRTRDPASGTWTPPLDVTPPGVHATWFTLVEHLGDGRLAMAFIGTSSNPSNWERPSPSVAPGDAVWHLYVVTTSSAASRDPFFAAYQLSSDDDPIQRGCVWASGPPDGPCRNLLDFIDITNYDGRAVITFADGCLRCKDAATSRSSVLQVVVSSEQTGQ